MKIWMNIDKSEWPRGEWDNEPDKAHWIDDKTNLDCLIVRGGSGALCGYVGVPETHPSFNKEYNEIETDIHRYIHGGLTFSDKCHPGKYNDHGVCHPKEGAANDVVWWLGFDCAHGGDVMPVHAALLSSIHSKHPMSIFPSYQYRNFDYVKDEVSKLASLLSV